MAPHETLPVRPAEPDHPDAPSEAVLEHITALARGLFGVAVAGLGRGGRQAEGSGDADLGPGTPLCAHAQHGPLVVLDTAADARFAPLADASTRFYAGAPLTLPDGRPLGVLYLADPVPRAAFSARERALLGELAAAAAAALQLLGGARRSALRLQGTREVLESITEAFVTLDREGRLSYANAQAGRLFSCERAALLGRRLDELPGTVDEALCRRLEGAARAGCPLAFEYLTEAKGSWLEVHVYPAAGGTSVFIRDISARKEEERRAAAQAGFRRDLLAFVQTTLQNGLDEGLYGRLLDVAIRTVPGAQSGSLVVRKGDTFHFVAAVGFELDKLRGCTFKLSDLPFDKTRPTPQLVRGWQIENLGTPRQEILETHGHIRAIKVSLSVPICVDGEPSVVLHLDNFADEEAFDADAVETAQLLAQQAASLVKRLELETALRAEREAFERAAYHDGLTGLPNRYLFEERLEEAAARARRTRTLLAVMFFDLDNFKDVNDTYGHGFGDALINAVAARMARTLRGGDLLARWGGDEFVALLPEVSSPYEVERIAERVLAALKQPFALADREIRTGASIGIALCEAGSVAAEDLVKNADVALYRAKVTRGRFHFYTDAMRETMRRRVELGEELRETLSTGGLELCFQPRVRLSDGTVTSVEALARWQHPHLGVVAPSVFIPLAEELGLIRQLGIQVLGDACAQAKRWQEAGRPIRVAVNVSVEQLKHPDFVGEVRRVLVRNALPPELLELEITESSAMDEVHENIRRLLELRQMGVQLSVDDFGTAYSSLAYLRQLPLHALKIDQSFVRNLTEGGGDNSTAIVRMVVMLGHALGLHVVAEGVETEAQRAALVGLGCDEAQGFLFAEPLSAEELGQMWRLELTQPV